MATILPEGVRIAHSQSLFIGGEWVAPKAGGTIEIVSPHTEQVSAVVAEAREADMDAAVAAAREAFESGPWPRMSVAERGKVLRKLTEILRERQTELKPPLPQRSVRSAPLALCRVRRQRDLCLLC